MANWASTSYVIEGPTETLDRIYKAIENPTVFEGSKNWEGNVLKTLGFEWEPHKMDQEGDTIKFSGHYMRGFIEEFYWNNDEKDSIRINAEEAWGRTDFADVLMENIEDIHIYWIVEEPGCEVYATNDSTGKYFPERFWVDTAQDDVYDSEYFTTEEEMYEWLNEKYGVKTKEEVDAWNQDYEATGDDCENFIYIHEFEILDD